MLFVPGQVAIKAGKHVFCEWRFGRASGVIVPVTHKDHILAQGRLIRGGVVSAGGGVVCSRRSSTPPRVASAEPSPADQTVA